MVHTRTETPTLHLLTAVTRTSRPTRVFVCVYLSRMLTSLPPTWRQTNITTQFTSIYGCLSFGLFCRRRLLSCTPRLSSVRRQYRVWKPVLRDDKARSTACGQLGDAAQLARAWTVVVLMLRRRGGCQGDILHFLLTQH